MIKTLVCLFFIVYASTIPVLGQGWTAYAGAGVSYDAFLRDKAITKYKVGWPFQVGASVLAGGAYHTNSGFNIFMDANFGLVRIQFPIPDAPKSRNHFEQGQLRLMVGSGPRINVGDKGNFVTPFIQLGASYMNVFGTDGVGNDDQNINVRVNQNDYKNHWIALFGAGIDWQFNAIVPSSINFQVVYSPLNIFPEPLHYTVSSQKGTYDLDLQGKIMQVMLSYKVHIWVKHSPQ